MDISANYNEQFSNWKDRNLSIEEIMAELKEKVQDELHIQEVVAAYKKKITAHKMQNGFILCGIGSFLCLMSCVLTMLNFMPEFSNFFLVGLTSIGVTLILAGFYFVFE